MAQYDGAYKVTEGLWKKHGDKRVVDTFCGCRPRIYAIRQRSVGDSLRVAIDGVLGSVSTPRGPHINLEPTPEEEPADRLT